MSIQRILISAIIISIFSIMIHAADYGINPVPVPAQCAYIPVDSLFSNIPAAPKIQYIYTNPQSLLRDTTTIYRGQSDNPLIEITASKASRAPRLLRDTALISPDGEIVRRAHASWFNDEWESKNYRIYDHISRNTKWTLSPSHKAAPLYHTAVVHSYDSRGEWTKASTYYNDNRMESSPIIERNIFYELTPDETSMIEHYTGMIDSVNINKHSELTIGLLIMAIAALFAVFTVKATKVNEALRGKLAGYLTGPLAAGGFCYTFEKLTLTYNYFIFAGVAIIFLVLMCMYIRYTVVHLEDNITLSNRDARNPFTFTAIIMALAGWYVGISIYPNLVGAIAGACIFGAAPVLSIPNRGLRCPKCHKMGTYRHTSDIEKGYRTDIKYRTTSRYTEIITKSIRQYNEVYECRNCGLRNVSSTVSEQIVKQNTVRQPLTAAHSPVKSQPEMSRADKAVAAIDYKDFSLYLRCNMNIWDCANYDTTCRIGADRKECQYSYCQVSCPFFKPSRDYMRRVQEKVRADNTPI